MKPDIEALLTGFPKRVPVFPLPNAVLFPGSLLPLRIFEPRYQSMLQDVLAGDGLIGMALLKQCSPEEYESEPPFHKTICVGHVIHHEPLPDGVSNIALLGLSAARAVPASGDEPYRTAEAQLLADRQDTGEAHERMLETVCRRALPQGDLAGWRDQLRLVLAEERIPAALVNTCALTAPVFPRHKLELLEERSLAKRLDRLAELLERHWQWN